MNARLQKKRVSLSSFLVVVGLCLSGITGCDPTPTVPKKPAKLRESDYQHAWVVAKGGDEEVRMRENTRADIVTKTHAIEVDFAEKWAESIGQSLHYARLKELKAGVLLIVDEEDDTRYLERWKSVVKTYELPIDLFTIDPEFQIELVE